MSNMTLRLHTEMCDIYQGRSESCPTAPFKMPLQIPPSLSLKRHLSYKVLSLPKILSRVFIHSELPCNFAGIQITTSQGKQSDLSLCGLLAGEASGPGARPLTLLGVPMLPLTGVPCGSPTQCLGYCGTSCLCPGPVQW